MNDQQTERKQLAAAHEALSILKVAGLTPEGKHMNDFSTPQGLIRASADSIAAGANKLEKRIRERTSAA